MTSATAARFSDLLAIAYDGWIRKGGVKMYLVEKPEPAVQGLPVLSGEVV